MTKFKVFPSNHKMTVILVEADEAFVNANGVLTFRSLVTDTSPGATGKIWAHTHVFRKWARYELAEKTPANRG